MTVAEQGAACLTPIGASLRQTCFDLATDRGQGARVVSSKPLYGDGDGDVSDINVGRRLSDDSDKRLYEGQITGKRAVAAANADGAAALYDNGVLPNNLRDASGATPPAAGHH